MKQQSISLAAWISLLSLALIWGFSFLAFALGVRELPVFTLVAYRVFLGAIILWAIILLKGIELPRQPKDWGALFVMGLFNNAVPFSLIAWGQIYVASGLASILNATTAFFAIVLAAIVFADERITKGKVTGVTFAFIGVCFVIGPDVLRQFDIRSLAQLAFLGASLSYAISAVWARWSLAHLNPLISATGMLTGSTLIMIPLALLIDGVPKTNLLPETIGAVLFLGIPATAIAYLLYYRSLRLAGSGNLSLVTILVTPIAVIVGAMALNEVLPITAYVGFAIIAAGMVIITKVRT